MEFASYLIYFTGRLLDSHPRETQWAHLRKLFPHASDEELMEFFGGERLLLAHGQTQDVAQDLVGILSSHGLECKIVPDAPRRDDNQPHTPAPRPHVKLASHLPGGDASTAASAPHVPPRPAVRLDADDEDRLTPNGRRWVWLGAIVAVTLLCFAIGSAIRGTYSTPSLATDGAAISSICVTDESTNWLTGRGTYALVCSAANDHVRYKLFLKCTGPDDVQASLAIFDPDGHPRPPAWQHAISGGDTYLPLRYRLGDNVAREVKLIATQNLNVGTLPSLNAREATALLSSSAPAFFDASGGDPIVFKLDSASWYIKSFLYGCGLAKPPG